MKFLLAPILALGLVGCNVTTPGVVVPGAIVTPVDTATPAVVVDKVIEGAATLCRFEPAADFVLDLINTSPTTGVSSWVKAVCDAVKLIPRAGPRSATRRSVPVPKINGVPLRGRYVG
jgi:hypothetical protein